MFLAACVQLRSTAEVERNLDEAERLIRRAAAAGAELIATPEATDLLGPGKVSRAQPLDGPVGARLAALAGELGVHLLVGSLNERALDPTRCHNTSALFGPTGALIARYRKIHLFDADLPGGGGLRESQTTSPGAEVVVAPTALGPVGLSVCYDLRFPELYAALVERGAEMLAVPSAFTAATGPAHWHALLRARAIETQCFVLAPAQWGHHDAEGARRSYGHSLIVDPWGTVLADAGEGEGLCLAPVDLEQVGRIRRRMPVASHRRLGGAPWGG